MTPIAWRPIPLRGPKPTMLAFLAARRKIREDDFTDEILITSSVKVMVASIALGSLKRRATRLRFAFSRRSRSASDCFINSLVRVIAVDASLSKAASVSKIAGISQGYQGFFSFADPVNVRLKSVRLKDE